MSNVNKTIHFLILIYPSILFFFFIQLLDFFLMFSKYFLFFIIPDMLRLGYKRRWRNILEVLKENMLQKQY